MGLSRNASSGKHLKNQADQDQRDEDERDEEMKEQNSRGRGDSGATESTAVSTQNNVKTAAARPAAAQHTAAAVKDFVISVVKDGVPGFMSIMVKLGEPAGNDTKTSSCKATNSVFEIIDAAFAEGLSLAVTFDLRSSHLGDFTRTTTTTWNMPSNAERLRVFFEKEPRASIYLRRARLASVLFKGSLFKETTVVLLGSVTKTLQFSCPLIFSHSRTTAKEFFLAAVGAADDIGIGIGGYVSVVGLKGAERHLTPEMEETCVASVAPLSKKADLFKSHSNAKAETSTIQHMLPNGDVRVIQSAPEDYIVTTTSQGGLCNISEQEEMVNDEEVKPPGSSPSGGAFSALLLKGPAESLRLLIGAHFNVAELLIDADALADTETSRSAQTSSSSSRKGRIVPPKQSEQSGCISGCLLPCINAFFPTAQPSTGPHRRHAPPVQIRVPHLKIRTTGAGGRTPQRQDMHQHMQHYGY